MYEIIFGRGFRGTGKVVRGVRGTRKFEEHWSGS
jgi:hypothetical protein